MYRGIRLRIPDLPDQLNIDRYFSLRMFKSGIVLEGHVKNLTQPLLMILENLTRRIIPSPSLLRRLPIPVNALNMTTTKTTIFLVSLAVSVS